MKALIDNLANLLKVKTIISLTVIGATTAGFLTGLISGETYMALASAIVTYFFTRKD